MSWMAQNGHLSRRAQEQGEHLQTISGGVFANRRLASEGRTSQDKIRPQTNVRPTRKVAYSQPTMTKRESIAVHGARVHNLRNISLEIPRDQLVVITGLSGSGKSSLAFDTLYAEGQRRYMESLSSYAKRFIAQVTKPDVDFVYGLSPVISIEQKTVGRNPRSTVGTMTDVSNYLNLIYATVGQGHCPYCQAEIPVKTVSQILDAVLTLGTGAQIELRAPIFPIYGEDYDFLFTEIRQQGYRHLRIDGEAVDLSEALEIDESIEHAMQVVIDTVELRPGTEKEITTSLQNALLVGDPFLEVAIVERGKPTTKAIEAFYAEFGCPEHHLVAGELTPDFFAFNHPPSACRTCLGLGTTKRVHPDLLVPDKTRSIADGCFVREAALFNADNWHGRHMHSLSKHYGFSLDTPFQDLPKKIVDILLYGTRGEKYILELPPGAKALRDPKSAGAWLRMIGKPIAFGGVAGHIERSYKWYRQKQVAKSGMEAWLDKVMVEHICPDCQGARLKASRLLFEIAGKHLHQVGEINFSELADFLGDIAEDDVFRRHRTAGHQILREIRARLDLLLGIGLNYLNFNRRSGTLSGGESQRIRLSTQIGSGLMGMLYVLDEPSIGLHPKDNVKMLATLRQLRDLGNTVVVVEHDEDTIRAADYLVEMGPGPGVHGGEVVVSGGLDDMLACVNSPTGQFLSGQREIEVPARRRPASGKSLWIRGARENNLRDLDVEIPLGQLVCITGASGSGKSTLVNEILFKKLTNLLVDSRVLSGDHDALEGIEHVTRAVSIDQAPLGRNSRSNPATYVGFYDDIRKLFAATDEAKLRSYKPGRFSFNVKTGRCPECSGEGTLTTKLYFMPDVEGLCQVCKGARFNPQTLDITYRGHTIADVLAMPIEDGVELFRDQPKIGPKIEVLDQLGLGYVTLGQSATTLSGGEGQRVKLASELAKLRRGGHTLYILDEPTTGLHLADIARLLECLSRLVDAGHSVVVIEHHLDVIKTADHVIDLGPEGGHNGGRVVATGTPEDIARCEASHTGRFLRERLDYASR